MKKRKSIFYYVRYKNLSAEITSYHAEISLKNTLLMYLLYAVICIVLGLLIGLKPVCLFFVAVASLFFSPYIVLCSHKNEYEQKRFSDATQYMQQMLYSFRSTGSIKTSLQDTMKVFDDTSYMRKLIEEALIVLDSPNYQKDATRAAFDVIEEEYACDRLFTIHDFLEKAEKNGGDYSQTIDILLQDRTLWVDRKVLFQEDKKIKKTEVAGSILMTFLMCWFIKFMPLDIDYTRNMLYQITGVAMMIFDLVVYVLACRKLTTDWFSQNEIVSEETTKKNYEYVISYDEKSEKRKSYKWLIIPAILLLIGFFTRKVAFYVIGGILIPVMLMQHKMKYHLCMKELQEEIQLKFPRWLMEITLLLQTMNVQKAIFSSIEHAPIVLVPELHKFRDVITQDPTSAAPYLDFMRMFKVPEVTPSMNMLYSLSQGQGIENSYDSQHQIAEIINRNNKLLDQAEKQADKKEIRSFSTYFFMPQISVCAMLIVILLVTMMGSFDMLKSLY